MNVEDLNRVIGEALSEEKKEAKKHSLLEAFQCANLEGSDLQNRFTTEFSLKILDMVAELDYFRDKLIDTRQQELRGNTNVDVHQELHDIMLQEMLKEATQTLITLLFHPTLKREDLDSLAEEQNETVKGVLLHKMLDTIMDSLQD